MASEVELPAQCASGLNAHHPLPHHSYIVDEAKVRSMVTCQDADMRCSQSDSSRGGSSSSMKYSQQASEGTVEASTSDASNLRPLAEAIIRQLLVKDLDARCRSVHRRCNTNLWLIAGGGSSMYLKGQPPPLSVVIDMYGQRVNRKTAEEDVTCVRCSRTFPASRFAPHLSRCTDSLPLTDAVHVVAGYSQRLFPATAALTNVSLPVPSVAAAGISYTGVSPAFMTSSTNDSTSASEESGAQNGDEAEGRRESNSNPKSSTHEVSRIVAKNETGNMLSMALSIIQQNVCPQGAVQNLFSAPGYTAIGQVFGSGVGFKQLVKSMKPHPSSQSPDETLTSSNSTSTTSKQPSKQAANVAANSTAASIARTLLGTSTGSSSAFAASIGGSIYYSHRPFVTFAMDATKSADGTLASARPNPNLIALANSVNVNGPDPIQTLGDAAVLMPVPASDIPRALALYQRHYRKRVALSAIGSLHANGSDVDESIITAWAQTGNEARKQLWQKAVAAARAKCTEGASSENSLSSVDGQHGKDRALKMVLDSIGQEVPPWFDAAADDIDEGLYIDPHALLDHLATVKNEQQLMGVNLASPTSAAHTNPASRVTSRSGSPTPGQLFGISSAAAATRPRSQPHSPARKTQLSAANTSGSVGSAKSGGNPPHAESTRVAHLDHQIAAVSQEPSAGGGLEFDGNSLAVSEPTLGTKRKRTTPQPKVSAQAVSIPTQPQSAYKAHPDMALGVTMAGFNAPEYALGASAVAVGMTSEFMEPQVPVPVKRGRGRPPKAAKLAEAAKLAATASATLQAQAPMSAQHQTPMGAAHSHMQISIPQIPSAMASHPHSSSTAVLPHTNGPTQMHQAPSTGLPHNAMPHASATLGPQHASQEATVRGEYGMYSYTTPSTASQQLYQRGDQSNISYPPYENTSNYYQGGMYGMSYSNQAAASSGMSSATLSAPIIGNSSMAVPATAAAKPKRTYVKKKKPDAAAAQDQLTGQSAQASLPPVQPVQPVQRIQPVPQVRIGQPTETAATLQPSITVSSNVTQTDSMASPFPSFYQPQYQPFHDTADEDVPVPGLGNAFGSDPFSMDRFQDTFGAWTMNGHP